MKRVVHKVLKNKCVLDLIAEMGDNVLGKRLFLCKDIIDKLFAEADQKIHLYDLYIMLFAKTSENPETALLVKEQLSGEQAGWFELVRIEAKDICFRMAPRSADVGLFFEISEDGATAE